MNNSNVATYLFAQFIRRHQTTQRNYANTQKIKPSTKKKYFVVSAKSNTEQTARPRHAWNSLSYSKNSWTLSYLQTSRSVTKSWRKPRELMWSHWMDVPTVTVTCTGRETNAVSVLVAALHDTRRTAKRMRCNAFWWLHWFLLYCFDNFILFHKYNMCVFWQRVFYFPLKPRLQKLLKIDSYRQSLKHEYQRPRNAVYMSDVYDSPAWVDFMGPVTSSLERIGLLFCVDAIPAFAAGTLSLKPMEFINLSLPPGVRSRAENIMLLMLLPSTLAKGRAQKKYYDFAADFELTDLATKGQ